MTAPVPAPTPAPTAAPTAAPLPPPRSAPTPAPRSAPPPAPTAAPVPVLVAHAAATKPTTTIPDTSLIRLRVMTVSFAVLGRMGSDCRSFRATSKRGDDVTLAVGVIAGADHGAGFHMGKSQRQGLGLERRKFIRCDITLDRQVLARGSQVLPQGEDVDADLAGLAQHRADLVQLLTQAQHQPGLGDGTAPLGVREDGVRARVAGLDPHPPGQAGDGLEVVGE